jgi:hypothetical protein
MAIYNSVAYDVLALRNRDAARPNIGREPSSFRRSLEAILVNFQRPNL